LPHLHPPLQKYVENSTGETNPIFQVGKQNTFFSEVAAFCIACSSMRETNRHILQKDIYTTWRTPKDVVPLWFIMEDAFWVFCDFGGRKAWQHTHDGEFIKQTTWNTCCMHIWSKLIVVPSSSPAIPIPTTTFNEKFWKSSASEFTKYKTKMDASFAFIFSRSRRKILLVRSANTTSFSLPGGKCHLEEGESVRACLERELCEELGWQPDINYTVHDYTFINKKRPFHLFFAEQISHHSPTIDRKEIVDYRWVSTEDTLFEKTGNSSKLSKLALDFWKNKLSSS
jgi:ADP-ribose pyrophosphatase YjhB (NUDIX family)